MKLYSDDQLLDEELRAEIIKEIEGPENQERKKDCFKRYDIFKDGTRKYVEERIKAESTDESFQEMKHRIANISICKKIVSKKAMVYKDSVVRESEEAQDAIDFYVDFLNHNTKMKKTNRYVELMKNCSYLILPYTCEISGKMKLRSQVLLPHYYDVIEDQDNPEQARVFIFSYMSNGIDQRAANPNETGIRPADGSVVNFRQGDSRDQIIADSPNDQGKKDNKHYIWWSNKYHFTTNKDGEIIPGLQEDDLLNPIQMLPVVNFAKDQDGSFWAIGGDDLIEGSILINHKLSDLFFIAKMQGMGIFYLIGKNVPEKLKIGPSDAIIMKKAEGDPDTQIGFASSSPPIDSWLSMVEQYIALLLTTNNLEPGTVQSSLSATTAASGIQEIIRKSENIEDIEDQREIYKDNEPLIFKIIFAWHNHLFDNNALDDKLKELGKLPEDFKLALKFSARTFITEKEKLEIIKIRRDLGLDTMIDSIRRDDPNLDERQAQQKILELLAEKIENKKASMQYLIEEKKEERGEEIEGKEEEDKLEGEDDNESE